MMKTIQMMMISFVEDSESMLRYNMSPNILILCIYLVYFWVYFHIKTEQFNTVGDIYGYQCRKIMLNLPVHLGNKTSKTDYEALREIKIQKIVVYL